MRAQRRKPEVFADYNKRFYYSPLKLARCVTRREGSNWTRRNAIGGPRKRYAMIALLLSFLMIDPTPAASQSFRDLLGQGLALMAAKDYEAALERFETILKTRPSSGGTLVLRAMAENRLGRHGDAYSSITQAERLQTKSPQLDFEKGWAAVGLQRWDEGLSSLERYEKSNPGNAKTAELMGRAYIAKGEYDKASELLQEAIRRNPAVKSTALYYLAFLEQARGKDEAADAYTERLLREAPQAPLARSLKGKIGEIRRLQRRGAAGRRTAAKPWQIGGNLSFGYNDNVLLLTEGDLNLPTDVTSNKSRFIAFSANAGYDWRLDSESIVSAGYVLQGARYMSVREADFHDHVAFAEYAKRISTNLGFTGRAGYGKTFLDGSDFSDRVSLRPAIVYRLTDRATVEGSYGLNVVEFSEAPATQAQDRDSYAHTFALSVLFDFSEVLPTDPRVRVDIARTSNEADGGDYDYGANTVSIAIDLSLPWKINLSSSFATTSTNYENANSFASAGATLFAFSRQDDQTAFRLELSRPIADAAEVFGEFRRIDNDSNIVLFDYDQKVWSIGLRARF